MPLDVTDFMEIFLVKLLITLCLIGTEEIFSKGSLIVIFYTRNDYLNLEYIPSRKYNAMSSLFNSVEIVKIETYGG